MDKIRMTSLPESYTTHSATHLGKTLEPLSQQTCINSKGKKQKQKY